VRWTAGDGFGSGAGSATAGGGTTGAACPMTGAGTASFAACCSPVGARYVTNPAPVPAMPSATSATTSVLTLFTIMLLQTPSVKAAIEVGITPAGAALPARNA